MVDLGRWREPIDTVIEIAQALRPEAWARFDAIARELEGPPPETAARRFLSRKPPSFMERLDWDAFLAGARQRGWWTPPTPPMTEAGRHRDGLAREGLCLRDEFTAVLIEQLQQKSWEGDALSERDGRRLKIPPATWFVIGLSFDLDGRTVTPGSAPRLLGVRFRPRRRSVEAMSERVSPQATTQTAAAAAVAVTAAPVRARVSEIRDVLEELYDPGVITVGFKPPSLREAGERGKRVLAERGRYAPASGIEKIAREQRYADVRLKRGEHLKD